jgi:hypothetical protein
MKKRFEPELEKPLQENRLLIITPFAETITRVTADTAMIRNRFMADLADEIMMAYAAKDRHIEQIYEEYRNTRTIKFIEPPPEA